MRTSKKIKIGNTFMGGGSPILVQSMLNIPSTDIENSVKQAVELENAGCHIIRFAIPNEQAKIIAVKKSRNDLAIKILGSPVIPSFIAPKIPVPLAQNRTIIAT